MPELDGIAEGAARWLARRHTRRSFLGRLGRGAVFVAGGSTLATLLLEQEAEARVCGQSGVSTKCDTYDCGDVWGWCWYASGCCAGGELKKICDCCRADHPNVHGYCPSGTNVLCIVESCGADPRVQVVSLRRVTTDEVIAASALASRARAGEGQGPVVWMVNAADPLLAAVVAPVAVRANAILLLTDGSGLAAQTIAELQRLGTARAVLAGTGIGPGVEQALARYGIVAERHEPSADAIVMSRRTTEELLAAGARRVVCIEPAGFSLAAAPLAGALAAAKGYPVVIGVDAARELSVRAAGARPVLTYMVGPEAASRAGEVQGGHPFHSADWASLSSEMFTAAFQTENVGGGRLALVPAGSPALHGALSFGGPILVHGSGVLEGVRDALFQSRDRFRSAALIGGANALSTQAYYELQSIVNGFEAHKLIGVAGQGLPVIDQPLAERPVGLARRSSASQVQAESRYWTDRVRSLGS
ncbi:MAG TPA: hypothetical protein VM345_13815 [Acidimicrobiales bacterium]|jgi:hypothetical protein|nr:hypothetical protein [Acidimicrobiales bacterium]